MPAWAQYAQIQANLADVAGSFGADAYLHFDLKNCGANVPWVSGNNLAIAKTAYDFRPDPTTGVINGEVIGVDQISCGNVNSSFYDVSIMKSNGQSIAPGPIPYLISSNTTWTPGAQPMANPPAAPGFVHIFGNPTATQQISQPSAGSGAVIAVSIGSGLLSSCTVVNGGTGYFSPPALTLNGGNPLTAGQIYATVSNGAVSGCTVGSSGSGYTSIPSVTVFGGTSLQFFGVMDFSGASVIFPPGAGGSGGGIVCNGVIVPTSVLVIANSSGQVNCDSALLVSAGSENSQSWSDNVTVSNAAPTQMKLASVGGVPSIGFNGPLSPILTAAGLGLANGPAQLDGSAVLPLAQEVTRTTNCDASHAILGNRTCGTIGTTALQTNGVNNTSQATINFQDAVAFHGLTLTWTNPSLGNEKPVIGGSLDLATQTHPSITVNGVTCTLGSSCTPSGSSGSGLLNSQGTLTAVTGTGSPANLFTFTIPGGTMSTTSCIRVTVGFQYTTVSGSPTYTFSFGGTGFTSPANGLGNPGQAQMLVCNTGATNTQVVEAFKSYQISQTVGAAIFGTAAVDTTVDQVVAFQFTGGVSAAVTPKFWMVENVH